jgi:hypothetical protein
MGRNAQRRKLEAAKRLFAEGRWGPGISKARRLSLAYQQAREEVPIPNRAQRRKAIQ